MEEKEPRYIKNILEKYNEKMTGDVLSSTNVTLSLGDIVQLYNILIVNDRTVHKTLMTLLENLSQDKNSYKNIEILMEQQKVRIENFFIEILKKYLGEP